MFKFDKIMKNILVAGFFVFMVLAAGAGMCDEPKKVAVIPFTMNSSGDLGFLQNGLFDMLSSRLSDPGKVVVLDRQTIDQAMKNMSASGDVIGRLNESKARVIGESLGVDYVLFGSLTNIGENVSLDTSMVDLGEKKSVLTFFKQSDNMGDVIPMINNFAGDINLKIFNRNIPTERYAAPETKAPAAVNSPENRVEQDSVAEGNGLIGVKQKRAGKFHTHLKFNGQINAMAAGDVNKDGVVEVVTATDSEINIYRLEGNKLSVVKQLDFASSNRIASLDIADINKNGFPEIFVTSMNIHRDGLQSFVVEYNGHSYITIADNEPYYFRVINGFDNSGIQGEKMLLGQRDNSHPFRDKIYTMTASGSSYSEQSRIRLPGSVSVLALARGEVTASGAKEYVFINEHGTLVVAGSSGSVEWKSNLQFGGSTNYYLLPRNDTDAAYTERVYLNPGIKIYDLGGDNKPEVFAVRNEEFGGGAFGRYKRFTKGNLEILSWDGIALAPVFRIPPVQGWVSAFAIADFNSDGSDELIVSIVGGTKVLGIKKQQISNIISYKLK